VPEQPERIRVLWLIKGLGPGGAEQLLKQTARAIDQRAFLIRVGFVRPDKTHLVPDFQAAGLQPELLTAGGRGSWVLPLRRAMAGAHVVHAHSPVLGSVARLLRLTLPPGKRPAMVYTEHNEWTSHRLPTRILNGLTAWLDNAHWAVSRQVRDTIWRPLRDSYQVLIHGIDTAGVRRDRVTRERVRGDLGVDADTVVGITVANLRRQKDYPNLLRAAKIALAANDRLVLLAVGQGPLAGEIEALHAELGLDDRFRLLGFRRDVHELMAAADFFVLGSAHEGLPVAIMEAYAAGLPVVATTVGGVPDAVTPLTGILVPPRDSVRLAEAILAMAGDAERRASMALAARAAADQYDIAHAVAEQEGAYRRLARRSAATR